MTIEVRFDGERQRPFSRSASKVADGMR
jgi:hypothetical protein